jgi:hypothetical protein
MRLLLLSLFSALEGYVVLVFFKQKTRRNAFISLCWLIGFMALSSAVTHLLMPDTKQLSPLAKDAALSILIILLVAFFCQLVAIGITRTIDWHREHNKANLHKQPFQFAVEHQAQLASLFTYFYFAASLLMSGGIWLGSAA